jgi:hypothetical protein
VSDSPDPGDQLLVDVLEAASHGVAVEDFLACHNAGATLEEVLIAQAANALVGYAEYRALGATHHELVTAKRISPDLPGAMDALGAPFLTEDTTLDGDATVREQSYRLGREYDLSHDQMTALHRAAVFVVDNPRRLQLVLTSTTHPVVGGKVTNVHSPLNCAGEHCCIHNPSEHHMVGWPQSWDSTKRQMERVCPHGVGHPDPDDPASGTRAGSVHGCDGCCISPE